MMCLLALLSDAMWVQVATAQAALPRLISESRLQVYLRYVNLSEPQIAEVGRLHKAYLADWTERCDADIATFNAAWNAVYTHPDEFVGPSMFEAFKAANENAERLKFKLKAANDFFFDQVEAIETEDQQRGMQRVRLAHDRWSYRRGKIGIRERHIDLIEMTEQLQLTDEEMAQVQGVLQEFEPVFVAALFNAADVDQRHAAFEFRILDIQRSFGKSSSPDRPPPDRASQQQMDVLLDQAGKLSVAASKRLVETNRKGLQQMLHVLTPESGAELKRRYSEDAYLEVYPDPTFAGQFYETAEAIAGLNENQRLAIEAFHQQYLDEHDRLSEKLAKSLYDLSVIFYRAELGKYQEKAALEEDKYRDLSDKREKLNLSQPARIRALLLPEQNLRLPPWKYENQSPPKRWDPGESSMRPPSPPRRAPVTTRPSTQPATQPE